MNSGDGCLGCLFGIFVIGVCLYQGYESIEHSGYIPHTVETSITAQANWLVGESKACHSFPYDADTARMTGKEPGYVAGPIVCDDGPPHEINVTVYARMEQPSRAQIDWNCVRDSSGFTCKQTGAQ